MFSFFISVLGMYPPELPSVVTVIASAAFEGLPYLLLKKFSVPSLLNPHLPASGAQPGTPACVIPPKLILALAFVPTLNPSTKTDAGLFVSKDSLRRLFTSLPLTTSTFAVLS